MRCTLLVCAILVTSGGLLPTSGKGASTAERPTPAEHQTVTINSLSWNTDVTPRLQQIRGVVTKTGSPIYLQDRTGGIELSGITLTPALRLGDEVEAVGSVVAGRYSSVMLAVSVRVLRVRVPDPALSVTASMAASGEFDRQFIDTSGTLLSVSREQGTVLLWIQNVRQLYAARLTLPYTDARVLTDLRAGSVVKVTGICLMADAQSTHAVPFYILLRSPKDVEILAGPPFWTRAHVYLLAALLVVLASVALAFATRVERWRFTLILEERTRMAHDLHDSLAQSFAGIAFQLQAIRLALSKRAASETLQQHVDLAISMVSHSHEDARRTIAMLKPTDNTEGSLLESLRHQAMMLTQGGELDLRVSTLGEPVELSLTVKQALLRIGHEAITNAVRHANPSEITLKLIYEAGLVRLHISDDGDGFVPSADRSRGFGLLGIRSRAASEGGTLRVRSAPQQGCEIEVSFPASGKLHPWRSFKSLERFVP